MRKITITAHSNLAIQIFRPLRAKITWQVSFWRLRTSGLYTRIIRSKLHLLQPWIPQWVIHPYFYLIFRNISNLNIFSWPVFCVTQMSSLQDIWIYVSIYVWCTPFGICQRRIYFPSECKTRLIHALRTHQPVVAQTMETRKFRFNQIRILTLSWINLPDTSSRLIKWNVSLNVFWLHQIITLATIKYKIPSAEHTFIQF